MDMDGEMFMQTTKNRSYLSGLYQTLSTKSSPYVVLHRGDMGLRDFHAQPIKSSFSLAKVGHGAGHN